MNQDLIDRAAALNTKLGKTLLGPDWTPDEERILSQLSGAGYNMAKKVKDLRAIWVKLMRSAGSDSHKKRVLKGLEESIERGTMEMNQVGYSARRTYDDRW